MARRKKQELVSRRDPKVQRKIEKSLKTFKSSTKFHSGEAEMEEKPADEQPDEDDYGYTSNVSDQFHKKLMEKYQKLPDDKKFSSGTGRHKAMSKEEIQSTKERMKSALAMKDDEHHFRQPQQPRKSKQKSERDGVKMSLPSVPAEKKNFQKPKPKLKAAPIVDFQQLLKLAEQKQHEEIVIEVPTKKEPERLLTMKEKKELEEVEAARRARLKPRIAAIPKLADPSKNDRNNNEGAAKRPPAPNGRPAARPEPSTQQRIPEKLKKPSPAGAKPSPGGSKLRDALQKLNGTSAKPSTSTNHKVPTTIKPTIRPATVPAKSLSNGPKPSPPASRNVEKIRPSTSREFPPKDLLRSREFPPKDLMKSREFPPRDLKRTKLSQQQQMSRKRE